MAATNVGTPSAKARATSFPPPLWGRDREGVARSGTSLPQLHTPFPIPPPQGGREYIEALAFALSAPLRAARLLPSSPSRLHTNYSAPPSAHAVLIVRKKAERHRPLFALLG